ncbi:MAG: hypothetical protein VKI63_04470 [Cyanobium sp.]|nr:hypothetical protein [Cyanobium sp.]
MNWAEPTTARVRHIAENLRRQDELEVAYSHGITGEFAVIDSWKHSEICRCIDGDQGQPVGICGVRDGTSIWLLATDELLATASHRRQFIRGGRQWVDELLANGHELLENRALASNRATLRWLKHLGFTVDTPEPVGRSLQLFCHFWRAA